MNVQVVCFFDEATFTASYVVWDPATRRAAIIDSVWDYDPAAARLSTASADKIIAFCKSENLQVDWILETHIHADHLTAAHYLKAALGGRVGVGAEVIAVQKTFGEIYGDGPDFARDGSQFDHLFSDGEAFKLGETPARFMHTPGHTPSCGVYLIGDAAFVGDTIFMPDYGTARTDFPGGDAGTLYRSIQKILALPPETRLFVGHDYKAPGRDAFVWETTVAAQKADNIHVGGGVSEADFVSLRQERDVKLGAPTLLWPAIQVNMRGGVLPEAADNGRRYLKIPLSEGEG